MRRTLAFLAVLLSLAAAPAEAQDRPALRASLAWCATGADPLDRVAVFSGAMPALPGTHRMEMRFDLYARGIGALRWQRVQAAVFGRWERSRPGRSGFVYAKRVDALTPLVAYRAVVRFRWLDAAGRVQRTARRSTGRCRPAEVRPDLRVIGLEMGPGGRYRATVVNDGRSGLARPADVVLTVAGAPQPARQVGALGPGQSTVVELSGPACPAGGEVRVQVDPDNALDEAEEANNALARPCGA